MHELYSEKDLQLISGQLKKRYLVLGAVLAALLAAFIASMIVRTEWLSIALFILAGAAAAFVIELFCVPLHRYKKLILSALTGRTHTEALEYKETEAETSLVDGVRCRGMIFLGDPDKHGTREQRFYWDEELPRPAFSPGDRITLKYTGRSIIGYEA